MTGSSAPERRSGASGPRPEDRDDPNALFADRRVLLVDDDRDFAETIADILEARGIKTTIALAGDSALAEAERTQPHVALLDVRLGRQSGVDLIAPLQQRVPGVACIMVTAYAAVETAVAALDQGAFSYLRKPLSPQELLATLQRCFHTLELRGERDSALTALADSERRFRDTFEQAAVGMAHVAPDGRFLRANRRFAEIVRYPVEELLSLRFQEITHPEDMETDLEQLRGVLAGASPSYSLEKRYLRKDGEPVWVALTVSASRDATGSPEYLISVIQDISPRKAAEANLQWELLVNETLAEVSQALISTTYGPEQVARLAMESARHMTGSPDGYVAEVQPGTGDLVSHTLTNMLELLGREPREAGQAVFSRDQSGCYPGLWGWVLNTRVPLCTNHPADHPAARGALANHRAPHRFLSVPVLFGGDLLGQISVANAPKDYTDLDIQALSQLADLLAMALHRYRDEEQTTLLNRQLRQAQKMEAVGTLAGGIAHDFNNILMPILGFTEMVKSRLPVDSQSSLDLDRVITSADRAAGLIRQILTFSRQTEQERHPVQLGLIVKETLKLLQASSPPGVELREDIAPDSGMVLADPTQMHQIVMNLCTNALYAMKDRGGRLAVTLAREEVRADIERLDPALLPGNYMKLTVTDTGEGITETVRNKLFDPFFTTKPLGEGTGLGLSVVHGIVRDHGGAISVESEPGRGASFTVYLPLNEDPARPKAPLESTLPVGQGTILVVDDDQLVLEVERRALESLGYTVLAYHDPNQALAEISQLMGVLDAVVTDYGMPAISGIEFAKKIHKKAPALPIILCTGHETQISPDQMALAGIGKIVGKPASRNDLGNALRVVMKAQQ